MRLVIASWCAEAFFPLLQQMLLRHDCKLHNIKQQNWA